VRVDPVLSHLAELPGAPVIRQKIALLLSTDLRAVARRLQEADTALQEVQDGLAGIVAASPVGTLSVENGAALRALGLTLADARHEVLMAYSDLTGRGPEKILPNRG
jgi:hypothetical protein